MSLAIVGLMSGAGQEMFEALRDDIVFGRLHPRERLIESDLVERFRSHRAAVREALTALDNAGLVDRQRNKGASVRELGALYVEQLYAVRALLETAAIEAIRFPVPPERIEAIVEIQREHEVAVSNNDLRRVFELNNAFHRSLYALSGNPLLCELIDQCATRALGVRFHTYMDPGFLTKVCEDHWAMLEAVGRGDRARLIAKVRAHLPLAKDRYLAEQSHSHCFVEQRRA